MLFLFGVAEHIAHKLAKKFSCLAKSLSNFNQPQNETAPIKNSKNGQETQNTPYFLGSKTTKYELLTLNYGRSKKVSPLRN